MLNRDIRPSTLEGVKRLATQIKKSRGIKHSIALDLAANAANCANFKHAQRDLPSRQRDPGSYRLFLTIYWYDQEQHAKGRETLEVELQRPLEKLCSKSELRLAYGFGGMRLAAQDHFVYDSLARSQRDAREQICKAVRSLRFMEQSGLRPSKDFRGSYPDGSYDDKLPGMDHSTDWYDPATGQYVLVDEPYSGVPDDAERQAWALKYGWHVRKSSWPGIYYPYSCSLYVATRAIGGFDFEGLMERINGIPAPLTADRWNGESSPSHAVFVSPSAKTLQDRRRAKSKGTVRQRATAATIPYNPMFARPKRRPAKAMPIAEHIKAGRMIKAALASPAKPFSVNWRLNAVRSTLEDWLALEIGPNQLDGPEFFEVYYKDCDEQDPFVVAAKTTVGFVQLLGHLRQQLQSVYPDCAPLRDLLHKIDVSARLAGKMKRLRR